MKNKKKYISNLTKSRYIDTALNVYEIQVYNNLSRNHYHWVDQMPNDTHSYSLHFFLKGVNQCFISFRVQYIFKDCGIIFIFIYM